MIKIRNIAPDWEFCEKCGVLKADGLIEKKNEAGNLIRTLALCQPCAFEEGFIIPETFIEIWRQRR
jgi:hypothetical protein